MDWDGGREAGLVDQTDLVSISESGGAGSANTSTEYVCSSLVAQLFQGILLIPGRILS